jgi:lincosamide nucleotidyltransferase A/C/D/E
MKAEDVVEFLQSMEQNGIDVVVDGGWGVDALLGHQTRPHDDLDVAVQHKDVVLLRELLLTRGYRELDSPKGTEFNFVLADAGGHKVDVHSYIFDSKGKSIEGIGYPFESLKGAGSINGHRVRCITAEWMVKFHTKYEPDEDDFGDVLALCTRFGIPLPEMYRKFVGK